MLYVKRPTRLNKTLVKTLRENHTQMWKFNGPLWVIGRLKAQGSQARPSPWTQLAGKHTAVHSAHTPSQASSHGGRHPPTSSVSHVDLWG